MSFQLLTKHCEWRGRPDVSRWTVPKSRAGIGKRETKNVLTLLLHEALLFLVLLSGTLCHRPYVYRPLHSNSFRVG